jgi:hypothetical protein
VTVKQKVLLIAVAKLYSGKSGPGKQRRCGAGPGRMHKLLQGKHTNVLAPPAVYPPCTCKRATP